MILLHAPTGKDLLANLKLCRHTLSVKVKPASYVHLADEIFPSQINWLIICLEKATNTSTRKKKVLWEMQDFSANMLNRYKRTPDREIPPALRKLKEMKQKLHALGLLLTTGFWFVLPINHSFPELSNLLTSVWMSVLSRSILSQHLSQSNMKIQLLKKEHCRSTEKSQLNKQTTKHSRKIHTLTQELFLIVRTV